MKKMFKTAASLAVGCALLSTSAFAALTGSVVESETAGTYTASVTKADATAWESTILVLKADSVDATGETPVIASTVNDGDIYYINQTSATSDTATYSIAQADETLYVFAGGSGEDAALYLGSIEAPAAEPENDYITSADTDKGTIKVDVASVTDASMGAAVGNAIVSLALNSTAYPETGYVVKVVDAEGNAIEGASVYYSTERAKYVALIPTTVSDYKFEILAADAEGAVANAVIAKYGNMNEDTAGLINIADYAQFGKVYKKASDAVSVTDAKKALIADISGDGRVNVVDYAQFGKAYKKQAYTFAVLTK